MKFRNREADILRHADPETAQKIAEQYPADWDMSHVFEKSFQAYLQQSGADDPITEADVQQEQNEAVSSDRLPHILMKKQTGQKRDTRFYASRPGVAACLLLTICTAGAIFYMQLRSAATPDLLTQQDSSSGIITEVTLSPVTSDTGETAGTAAGATTLTTPTTLTTTGSESVRTTTAQTVRTTIAAQTVLPEQTLQTDSSPSEPDVTNVQAEPRDGTSPIAPTTSVVTALQPSAQTVIESSKTYSETQPVAESPQVRVEFVPGEAPFDNLERIVVSTDQPAELSNKQYVLADQMGSVAVTDYMEDAYYEYTVTLPDGTVFVIHSSPIASYYFQYRTGTRNINYLEIGGKKAFLSTSVNYPDTSGTIVWIQDQTVFIMETPIPQLVTAYAVVEAFTGT
ncbi:MAG TPA: hypothetical protein DCG49_09945 [Ruminococcus sp.]|nr:hypothetical protein [Ruminococcus sp.]